MGYTPWEDHDLVIRLNTEDCRHVSAYANSTGMTFSTKSGKQLEIVIYGVDRETTEELTLFEDWARIRHVPLDDPEDWTSDHYGGGADD